MLGLTKKEKVLKQISEQAARADEILAQLIRINEDMLGIMSKAQESSDRQATALIEVGHGLTELREEVSSLSTKLDKLIRESVGGL